MTIKMAGIVFLFLCFTSCAVCGTKRLLTKLEDRLEDKLCMYIDYITKYLEDYNDRNLGNSEIGRYFGYKDLKPKYTEETERNGKSMKKMSMALMPLLFHVGASTTWMLITTLLAAKSVGIGLLLLVFKIAVSSAKVASFFTALKGKHEQHWSPPIEHGHYRSIDAVVAALHPHADWQPPEYTPDWNEPPSDYKTVPYERISKEYATPTRDK